MNTEGGSALSPAMDRFLAALDAAIAGGDEPAGFRAALASSPRVVDQPRQDAPFGLPVCQHWEPALTAASRSAIAAPLRELGPALVWSQNPNYRRNPPDPTFLDNYGYAVMAGPANGVPALVAHEALALGVLLLGPHTHYPRHAHPAAEIYLPLNIAEWWKGEGPWVTQPPGITIHHAPNVPHATRTGAAPLVAIYLWRGDLATYAQIAPATAAAAAPRGRGRTP